jgi:MFS transporter, ACS family, solute carrier family 17 (sodium-dependent inorganic phosphate cotransporter), other
MNVESDPIDSHTISKSELQLILDGRIGSKVQGSKFPSLRELFSKTQFLAVTLANVVNNWVRMVYGQDDNLTILCTV